MKNALILFTTQILECPKITFTLTCIYVLINTAYVHVVDCLRIEMIHTLKLHCTNVASNKGRTELIINTISTLVWSVMLHTESHIKIISVLINMCLILSSYR